MSAVYPELIATQAIKQWLLLNLKAKVDEVNLQRAAVLTAAYAGPYTIAAGKQLGLNVDAADGYTTTELTEGSRTAAQLAADINAGLDVAIASADDEGRLVITSPTPPIASSPDAPSVVKLRGNFGADCNAVFGWDPGGMDVINTALIAPGVRDISDGMPTLGDLCERGPGTICVVLGDKKTRPVSANSHVEEYFVVFDLTVLRVEPLGNNYRNAEPIYSALRCVREVLLTDDGKQLGRASVGDVQRARELGPTVVKAMQFRFTEGDKSTPLFDGVTTLIETRLHMRPTP